MDSKSYADWNPYITHVTVDFVASHTIEMIVELDGYKPRSIQPLVASVKKEAELRWIEKLDFDGVFNGEHYFSLTETPQGTTILRHGNDYSGALAYPFLALIGESTVEKFAASNLALKSRVESKK